MGVDAEQDVVVGADGLHGGDHAGVGGVADQAPALGVDGVAFGVAHGVGGVGRVDAAADVLDRVGAAAGGQHRAVGDVGGDGDGVVDGAAGGRGGGDGEQDAESGQTGEERELHRWDSLSSDRAMSQPRGCDGPPPATLRVAGRRPAPSLGIRPRSGSSFRAAAVVAPRRGRVLAPARSRCPPARGCSTAGTRPDNRRLRRPPAHRAAAAVPAYRPDRPPRTSPAGSPAR